MAEIVYCSSVSRSDPSERPVTILGKKANLSKLQFSDVSRFLGSKVSAEVSKLCKISHNVIHYHQTTIIASGGHIKLLVV